MGIVVFGACFVDIKGYPLAQYIPGGRNVGRVVQVHGGVSRNVAEDIANVELRPTLISVVDHTGTSTDVIEKLNRHQVNTQYIRRSDDGLGTWLALFDSNGDVIGSVSKRPDLREITDILNEFGDQIFAEADSIVVEIDMEPSQIKRILELAKRHGKEVYAVVSNMSLAMERRDLLHEVSCIVCNEQEAGMLFSEDRGAVYASVEGESGYCPPQKVDVIDTTGAGDAFFAGVAIGLTYHKTLGEACEIGTRLASSVIATKENVCPRFLPEELGITMP